MDPITENAKPDPKVTAQLDGIAKKNVTCPGIFGPVIT
jgi:hypothetical protein